MSAQSLEALARANAARLDAVAVKHEIRDGGLTAADALYDPRAGAMTVAQLLRAQWRWGDQRVRRLLADVSCWGPRPRAIDVAETRRVRDLTDRERDELARALGDPR